MLIKQTDEYRVPDEQSAVTLIEKFRTNQVQENYFLAQSSYTYHKKTLKGEIVDEWYIVKIVKEFDEV